MIQSQWDALRTQWETGSFSNISLSLAFHVTESAIRKRVAKEGWRRAEPHKLDEMSQRLLLERLTDPDVKLLPHPKFYLPEAEKNRAPIRSIPRKKSHHGDGSMPKIADKPQRGHRVERFFQFDDKLAAIVWKALSSEDGARKAAAEVRAAMNQDALTRVAEVADVRQRFLDLIRDALSEDTQRRSGARLALFVSRYDSLRDVLTALIALDRHITNTQRLVFRMDEQREDKRLPLADATASLDGISTDELMMAWKLAQTEQTGPTIDAAPVPPEPAEAA